MDDLESHHAVKRGLEEPTELLFLRTFVFAQLSFPSATTRETRHKQDSLRSGCDDRVDDVAVRHAIAAPERDLALETKLDGWRGVALGSL